MNLRRASLGAAFIALLSVGAIAASAQSTPTEKVVFAAWNIRNYLLDPPQRDGGRATPAKTEQAAEAVVDVIVQIAPDILGLCEMGSRRDLADFQQRLKKRGLIFPYATWVAGEDKERHLALLSRFPIAETQHVTNALVREHAPKQHVQRGFLDCTIAVRPDFSLRVLGTHLKSRRVVVEFDQAEFRRKESLLLRHHVEAILEKNPETPLLVFGDFNDVKNSPAVAGLLGRAGTKTSLSLVPLQDRRGESWTYHWAATDEYSRVDYVMVGNALRPLIDRRASRIPSSVNWSKASDHRPLVVTLRLPRVAP